jgi:hypothetical protein
MWQSGRKVAYWWIWEAADPCFFPRCGNEVIIVSEKTVSKCYVSNPGQPLLALTCVLQSLM